MSYTLLLSRLWRVFCYPCLCPLFCLAPLSSLSLSLYLSLISPPLTFQIYPFLLPPDKATIVPQMLFNMESLSVSLCKATHQPRLCLLLLLTLLHSMFYVQQSSKWSTWHSWLSIQLHHSTLSRKLRLSICQTRMCMVSVTWVCFCENFVSLLTRLGLGTFAKAQQTSSSIVLRLHALSSFYLHPQEWS